MGEDFGEHSQDLVFGEKNKKGDKFSFVKNPKVLTNDAFHDLVAPLNTKQRNLFYHYVHNI